MVQNLFARITQANSPSLPELAYRAIREAILGSTVRPGQPLRQEEIAQQLGISRLPVREALRRLEVEGLAVLRPRCGYVVAAVGRTEIEDVFDLRAMLEQKAGFLATKARRQEDIADVRVILKELERTFGDKESSANSFAELNGRFHERLAETSGRSMLCRTHRIVLAASDRYTRMSVGLSGNLGPSMEEHRRIFEAFVAGKADEVGELSRLHCENTCHRLLSSLGPTMVPDPEGTERDDQPSWMADQ